MDRKRKDGLILLLLGGLIFVMLGGAMEQLVPNSLLDFKALYLPARCLVHGCDPYSTDAVSWVSASVLTNREKTDARTRQIITQSPYPPTVFALSLPFAILPLPLAQVLWIGLLAATLLLASFLIWDLSSANATMFSAVLIAFLLANSEVLLVTGVCAGIVTAFCVIACWCFTQNRFHVLGLVCLAMALAVKPQDAALVWLYFLLASSSCRKRALETLGVFVVLAIPCLIWVSSASPHWIHEFSANIAAYSVRGGINDPGPGSTGAHGLAMVVSLQAVFSVFRDDPRFYNLASYLVCGPLFLAWLVKTLKGRLSKRAAWLSLAVVASLTMLPVYHRQYDTKLLLLTVPASAMLWEEGSRAGRVAVLLNCAAFVFNGDLTSAAILGIVHRIPTLAGGLSEDLLIALQVFPAPLSLLASSVVFLWLFMRSGEEERIAIPLGGERSAPSVLS